METTTSMTMTDYSTTAQSPATTAQWYTTQYGCLRTDPTLIAKRHTFPDAQIPIGFSEMIGPPMRQSWNNQEYRTAWTLRTEGVSTADMVDTERDHPQFAFRAGAPGTVTQIDAESNLRRLGQPLGQCTQGILPMDAPLFRNTVAPPTPIGVPENVQNAANPVAALIRQVGAEQCRIEADRVASSLSGRTFNNPTRYDTMRFVKPFTPPGIGSAASLSSV